MAIFPARRRSHQYKPSAFAGDIRQPHGARLNRENPRI